ncbi:DUF4179 domain-containing protein [Saccharibacillus alkalitolerans]|uniref:DUF4179 domain-containing protein n=1 Tax=Saccharibacillus alkalitolerans TaxID=2705290 RepID=A0ABX0FBN0_9BACL|nr:DUF4179 domain-containing protein [Saccharibacillus alkalitolerans]NGZ77364.1 DUF4179 domain-containing protein [Saccharibacillus alkalitolerans]
MTNHEEEKLRRDAERAARDSEKVGSMELNEATRRGIGQGKKRAARRRAVYGTGAVTAAAAAMIALSSSLMPGSGATGDEPGQPRVTAGVPNGGQEADAQKENPKDYRGVGMDANVSRIIERGHMSSIDRTVSKDGYTLTLRGEAMDDRKMFVALSVKNDTDQIARVSRTEVDFGEGVHSQWKSRMGTEGELIPGSTATYIAEIELSPEDEYPEDAIFRAGITPGDFGRPAGQEVTIDVPFKAHTEALKDEIETVEVNRELEVSGQKIEVKSVEITPLGIYLDYAENEANDKRLFSLIDPKLKLTDADGTTVANPRFIGGTYGKDTLNFEAADLESPSSIDFSVAGISAADPEQTRLVLDTETGKIVEGGEGLTVSVDPDEKEITLERTVGEYNEYNQVHADAFMLEETFTDAKGIEHKLSDPLGERENRDGKMTESLTVGLGAGEVAQPAEFRIRSYWNPILEAAELKIK